MAEQITINAKCQRMGVCNAAESLVVHMPPWPRIPAADRRGASPAGSNCAATSGLASSCPEAARPPTTISRAEYLGPVISVKVVDSLDEAIEHINHYGSQHTEAIVTSDWRRPGAFTAPVDSAAVMVNASTRFNDGGEFGLGAEIGISTDKFQPAALAE